MRKFVKSVETAAYDENASLERKEQICDDLMLFYKKNISTRATREKIGLPEYLYLWEQTEPINS